MSDQTPPAPPQPLWLRVVNNQHFKLVLTYLFKASGVLSLPWVTEHFPDLTIDSAVTWAIAGLPYLISFAIDWYRNNPNNIVRRAVMVLNGANNNVTGKTKAAVVDQVAKIPGTEVHVDMQSNAPLAVKQLANDDKAPDVLPKVA